MWPYLTIDNNCGCEDCAPCTPSTSLCYAGPNLLCTGIQNKDTLSVALQKIEASICTTISNIPTLQQVTNSGSITTHDITSTGFILSGGLSSEFLKADGSIDDNNYALDSSVVHLTGNETIEGLKSIKGSVGSDTAPLGVELATTATGTNWVGTDFATGYTHTVGSTVALTSTLDAVIETYYQITYTITGRTAGSITINYGGSVTSGLIATGATGPIAIDVTVLNVVPTTDFDGTLVLSVKTIGNSIATFNFLNSSGDVVNEIRNSNTVGNYFNGIGSGSRNTTGRDNTGLGYRSLFNNTTGYYNTSIGEYALTYNTVARANSALGYGALYYNTTGYYNVGVGSYSLFNNTTGWQNTAIGHQSLQQNTTGIQNTAVGAAALSSNTTGESNAALGQSSGRWIANKSTIATILSNSVMLGFRTTPLADNQINQIVIGYDSTGLGSNTTVLGNSSIAHTAIYGNLLLGKTSDVGGKLQIVGAPQTGTSGIGILNLEQTWNTTAIPTAIKLNITNTASNAQAKLIDLQVGGVSRFYVDRVGNGLFSDGGTASIGFGYGGGTSISLNGTNLAKTSAGGVIIGGNFSNILFSTNNVIAMAINTTSRNVTINSTSDIGAKFQVIGKTMLNGTRFFGQPIPEALITPGTLNADQIEKGIITVTNTIPTSFQLPSGTNLDGNLFAASLMSVDTGLDYTFINLGTATATITSGTDNPLVGNGIVNAGSSATFRSVKRATNVFETYRIT